MKRERPAGEDAAAKRALRVAPASDADAEALLLPEMRAEIGRHLTLVDRFAMAQTHKAAFTEEAQCTMLVETLEEDILWPWLRESRADPNSPLADPDSGADIVDAISNMNADLESYSTDTGGIAPADYVSMRAHANVHAFLLAKPLPELKATYADLTYIMALEMSQVCVSWLRGLFSRDHEDTLYTHTAAKSQRVNYPYKWTTTGLSINVDVRNPDGMISQESLYEFDYILYQPTRADLPDSVSAYNDVPSVPILTLGRGDHRPHRTISAIEQERVRACQAVLARFSSSGAKDDTFETLLTHALTDLIRLLLRSVDLSFMVSGDYRRFEDIGIDPSSARVLPRERMCQDSGKTEASFVYGLPTTFRFSGYPKPTPVPPPQ
jgi:hypothetical protein